MIKHLLLLVVFSLSMQLFAQTGIGTTSPNPSAKLEIFADNKGFLPPRVLLTSATDNTTVPNAAEGLLVYNKGTLGLQAGYYYWNGANWATIATAAIAGTGVASSDMVKLYSEAYSAAVGKIAHTNGYTFTVPVSGRYLFDFACSGFGNATIYFKVRQGTTDLASDFQTSDNNNVHVEYNGKLEVNLQVGTTYNVFLSTSGYMNSGDYNRVYYKLVAGNLPINQYTLGDVKTGIQSTDHNGWVKLDGRLKSTLTASQQLQATALGISSNLPDATNAVLMQSSGSLGSVTGSMSRTLAQNQLPDIAPSITVDNTIATMQNAGSHQHPISVVSSSIGGYAAGNPTAFKKDMAPTSESNADLTDRGVGSFVNTGIIGSAGDHNHTINTHGHSATSSSINGGVTQQTIDITPRKLVVNTFIYLGY